MTTSSCASVLCGNEALAGTTIAPIGRFPCRKNDSWRRVSCKPSMPLRLLNKMAPTTKKKITSLPLHGTDRRVTLLQRLVPKRWNVSNEFMKPPIWSFRLARQYQIKKKTLPPTTHLRDITLGWLSTYDPSDYLDYSKARQVEVLRRQILEDGTLSRYLNPVPSTTAGKYISSRLIHLLEIISLHPPVWTDLPCPEPARCP